MCRMVKELLPLLFPAAQDFFDVLFNLYARQHNLMAAFLAADLKIHAHAQYVKPVGPTGVRLFGYDHITNLNIENMVNKGRNNVAYTMLDVTGSVPFLSCCIPSKTF